MAVVRIGGRHLNNPGRPNTFRTVSGQFLPLGGRGTNGAAIEAMFSRKGETANLDAVKAQHANALKSFSSEKGGTTVYITNNTDHIERLNDGWSAQTEAGFFERALYEAAKSVVGTWKWNIP